MCYNGLMDGQDYLNQIASSVRPEKKSRFAFLNSPISKVIAIGIVLFIIVMIVGSSLTGSRVGAKDQAISLKLHIDNTLSIIAEYQPAVKSSELRSSSASLYSVLSNTSRDLTDVITNVYEYKPGKEEKKLVEAADLERDGLESSLAEAKINGILDKIYASRMSYEISLIMSKETNLYNTTGSDALMNVLKTSYDSLGTLHAGFDEFSETK